MNSGWTILLQLIQFLAAFFFVCFIPGLSFSYSLFPKSRLDPLERNFLAFISSIALSSLLASGLILIQGQISSFNYSIGILIMISIFTLTSIWRVKQETQSAEPGSQPKFDSVFRTLGPVLLAALLIFFVIVSLAIKSAWFPIPSINQTTEIKSGITEFFISPQEVDEVLESINNHQSTIDIPLGIINHTENTAECRLEILITDQLVYEQGGIIIPAAGNWEGIVKIAIPDYSHSQYLDLILLNQSAKDPVAHLRLWL